MRKVLWAIVGCLGLNVGGLDLAQADGVALRPYVATYAVTFRGLNGGTLRMELSRDPETNRYTFETRVNPSTLASFVIGRDAVEQTILEPTADGIRPVQWYLDDGKKGKDGDGKLVFDWSNNKVTGEYEGKPVELPTQPGLQDRLSIQVAVSAALLQGREPTSLVMVNGDKTREYNYVRGGTTQLDTTLGKLETIIYESTRPGSSRVSKMWHAPSLEFLPVRAEQIRKGKVETVMTLVSLERR
jgi:hypothetical protein